MKGKKVLKGKVADREMKSKSDKKLKSKRTRLDDKTIIALEEIVNDYKANKKAAIPKADLKEGYYRENFNPARWRGW